MNLKKIPLAPMPRVLIDLKGGRLTKPDRFGSVFGDKKMDMCYCNKPGGLTICVMIDGNRDNNGNITTVHEMEVVFRKTYEWGFSPIGGIYCPRCIRERRYQIPPEKWDKVNAKYCGNRLTIV